MINLKLDFSVLHLCSVNKGFLIFKCCKLVLILFVFLVRCVIRAYILFSTKIIGVGNLRHNLKRHVYSLNLLLHSPSNSKLTQLCVLLIFLMYCAGYINEMKNDSSRLILLVTTIPYVLITPFRFISTEHHFRKY